MHVFLVTIVKQLMFLGIKLSLHTLRLMCMHMSIDLYIAHQNYNTGFKYWLITLLILHLLKKM
jgi:hypothetical protein